MSIGRSPLFLCLALALAPAAASQQREIDLAWIRSAGSEYQGTAASDFAGRTLAAAGDVNGDGRDDVLIGAWDLGTFAPPGKVYLVYGQQYFDAPLTASLTTADVTILGVGAGSRTGSALGAAGDVNGDGYDDILIGASRYTGGPIQAGRAYLLWGGPSLPAVIDLASLPGPAGVIFEGAAAGHLAGRAVDGAGDVNGDTVPDLLIGAPGVNNNRGRAYVVYGSGALPQTFSLASLPGAGGVVLDGIDVADVCGDRLSRAGDFDDDGFADVLVGALTANPGAKDNAGQAYLLYGGPALPQTVPLSTLGSAGVKINGHVAGDQLGADVAGGADVNGDGFDDVVVGAKAAGGTGRAYVVWGGAAVPATVEVAQLGAQGVVLQGAAAMDDTGNAVALGRDVNRDGRADVLVGAPNADPNGTASGTAYLVYGSNALPQTLSLGALSFRGVALNGVSASDLTGSALAFLGDVNGDTFGDYAVGAYLADPGGTSSGRAWVVQGACSMLNAAGPLDEGETFTLTAHGPPNRLSVIFITAGLFAAPIETGVGPFWLQDAILLDGLFQLNADGQWSLPVTVPSGVGLSGLTLYWQVYIDPQAPWNNITQVLETPIP